MDLTGNPTTDELGHLSSGCTVRLCHYQLTFIRSSSLTGHRFVFLMVIMMYFLSSTVTCLANVPLALMSARDEILFLLVVLLLWQKYEIQLAWKSRES